MVKDKFKLRNSHNFAESGVFLFRLKAIYSKISRFTLDLFLMFVEMYFIEFLFKIIPIEAAR